MSPRCCLTNDATDRMRLRWCGRVSFQISWGGLPSNKLHCRFTNQLICGFIYVVTRKKPSRSNPVIRKTCKVGKQQICVTPCLPTFERAPNLIIIYFVYNLHISRPNDIVDIIMRLFDVLKHLYDSEAWIFVSVAAWTRRCTRGDNEVSLLF